MYLALYWALYKVSDELDPVHTLKGLISWLEEKRTLSLEGTTAQITAMASSEAAKCQVADADRKVYRK